MANTSASRRQRNSIAKSGMRQRRLIISRWMLDRENSYVESVKSLATSEMARPSEKGETDLVACHLVIQQGMPPVRARSCCIWIVILYQLYLSSFHCCEETLARWPP